MFKALLSLFRPRAANKPAEARPAAVAAADAGQTYLCHRPILDRGQRVVAHELSVDVHRALRACPWQVPSRKLFEDVLLRDRKSVV